MSMKKFVKGIQWANFASLILQSLNNAMVIFPDLTSNKWVLIFQAAVGILLPSIGGLGHQLAYGEPQDPAKR